MRKYPHQLIDFVDDGKDGAGDVDVEKFGNVKNIGVAGMIGLALVGGGDSQHMGLAGQSMGNFPKQAADFAPRVPNLLFDFDFVSDGQLLFVHQLINVEADGGGGGRATGGGMGLGQVALVNQAVHFVADSGRRDADLVFFVKSVGADGFGGLGIFFDDGAKDFDLAVG